MFRFKSFLCSIFISLFFLIMSGIAHATIITIGTATYNGHDYNLIWDDDNNGNSVVWLDFTNDSATWNAQVEWAATLANALTIKLYDGYALSWLDDAWRLPATFDEGPYPLSKLPTHGDDGTTITGYNVSTSEMGHLYYVELGNTGLHDLDGNIIYGSGLTNTGEFVNLVQTDLMEEYWSGTELVNYYTIGDTNYDKSKAYNFDTNSGQQWYTMKASKGYAIAIRSGQISVSSVPEPGAALSSVPEPGAALLLGAGLLSLAGLTRKKHFNKA